ncbi:MAG TPA: MATE family efflux transporter [Petrotogaceae bacterium]|nr:MATE family efflux transporter [Petrotogaceae bacterium]
MEGFYKRAFKLALPMALQQFISISVNFVDTLMIGQLGEIPIAAVGLSNKVFFLYSLLLFGLCSGGSIFIAQFWGKKDFKNISKSMSIMAVSSVIFSSVFFVMGAFFPHFTMRIFSPDIQVINQELFIFS